MFTYFARLIEKYNLPVFPVVIFSYDAPQRPEPHRYRVAFPGQAMLQFDYRVIQLNRLSWRKYVRQHNQVASALMAKMKIAPRDRPNVRLECLRLLATLKLDPAKSQLIGGFIETYLQMNTEEMKQYEREFAKLTPPEKEATMELMTSWERKGREEGRQEGKEELLALLIQGRFGSISAQTTERLNRLSSEQLNELVKIFFEFKTPADLETWVSRFSAQ